MSVLAFPPLYTQGELQLISAVLTASAKSVGQVIPGQRQTKTFLVALMQNDGLPPFVAIQAGALLARAQQRMMCQKQQHLAGAVSIALKQAKVGFNLETLCSRLAVPRSCILQAELDILEALQFDLDVKILPERQETESEQERPVILE